MNAIGSNVQTDRVQSIINTTNTADSAVSAERTTNQAHTNTLQPTPLRRSMSVNDLSKASRGQKSILSNDTTVWHTPTLQRHHSQNTFEHLLHKVDKKIKSEAGAVINPPPSDEMKEHLVKAAAKPLTGDADADTLTVARAFGTKAIQHQKSILEAEVKGVSDIDDSLNACASNPRGTRKRANSAVVKTYIEGEASAHAAKTTSIWGSPADWLSNS